MRELGRIFIPVADGAGPAQIHDKQLHSHGSGNVRVAHQGLLVDLFLVRPGIPGDVGESPGGGRGLCQHRLREALRAVTSFVPIAVKQTQESIGRLEIAELRHRMVQIEHRRGELDIAWRFRLADCSLDAAVEFPSGEQAPHIRVAEREPSALLPPGPE